MQLKSKQWVTFFFLHFESFVLTVGFITSKEIVYGKSLLIFTKHLLYTLSYCIPTSIFSNQFPVSKRTNPAMTVSHVDP